MGFIQKNKVYIAAVIVIVGIVIYFTVFRNTSSQHKSHDFQDPDAFGSSCQGMANKYGVISNVTFGWAPTWAQDWWQRKNKYKDRIAKDASDKPCYHIIDSDNPTPEAFGSTCQGASNRYMAHPGYGRSMPKWANQWWVSNKCATSPTPLDDKEDPSIFGESCDNMRGRYGVIPGKTFGGAPKWAQDWWQRAGKYSGRMATDKGSSKC